MRFIKVTAGIIWPILLVSGFAAPERPQDPTCRDHNRIRIADSTLQFTFNGTGTHHYGTGAVATDVKKAGAFDKGIYTCWHPEGWKYAEIAFDGGVKVTAFDRDGKVQSAVRSKNLAMSWHPSGRLAFHADGGRCKFWHSDGTIAADIRMCQEVWRAWRTDVEVDEWDVWSELLYHQYAGAVLPRILAGIQHQDAWVRAYACDAVSTLGRDAEAAVPALRRALVDAEFWLVRRHAASALARLGPVAREAVPELVEVVRNREEHAETRVSAARALGEIGARAAVAVPALEEASRLGPTVLRVEAIAALLWIDPADRGSVRKLASLLTDKTSALPAAEALFRVRAAAGDARTIVQSELKKQGEEITDLAMTLSALLHHLDPKAEQPSWFDADLEGPWPLLPEALTPEALFTFCLLDEKPEAIGDAIDALADCDNKYMRERFHRYAATIGPEARAAAPALVHLLSSSARGTREWAERALVNIGPPAIPALTTALHPRPELWSYAPTHAVQALATIGEPSTLALAGALAHKSRGVAVKAASALGRLGPAAKVALPALKQAFGSSTSELREAAAVAIAKIEGAAARAPR